MSDERDDRYGDVDPDDAFDVDDEEETSRPEEETES